MTDPFSPPPGMNPLMFRGLLWKRYMDVGSGITNTLYLRYGLLAVMGDFVLKSNVFAAIISGGLYVLLMFVVGWFWHRFRFVRNEIEISNRFNSWNDYIVEQRKMSLQGQKMATIVKEPEDIFADVETTQ